MKVVQRKRVRELQPQMHIWVPAWAIRELGFQPGDERDWVLLEDDNGERLVGLRRIAREKEEEGEAEEKKGEEGDEEDSGVRR